MEKKCKNCEAPIGGFWGMVAGLWGVKRSKENPNLCNKCAGEGTIVDQAAEQGQSTTPTVIEPEVAEVASVGEAMKHMGLNGEVEEDLKKQQTSAESHDCPGADVCTHPSHGKAEMPAGAAHGEEGHVCTVGVCPLAPKN